MANYKDVNYIRSSVSFTHISSPGEIKATSQVNVKWNLVLKYPSDLEELYLVRAVLNNGEKADLGSKSVLNKFRTIYRWKRAEGGSPLSEFTDVFKWDDNSDNNLHNLNTTNDSSWDQKKFKAALRRIAAGEQGILYKIYGYSRRMGRAATPIGFFCDGSNIVALSQRNQIINDKWYNECGQVWKAGASVVGSGEKFVRVAVDMNRDLGENPKKSRCVWASTNKGRIVLFDYWTGKIIWQRVVSPNIPIYAIAYDANNDVFVYYDGNGYIETLKADTSVGYVGRAAKAGPFNDFKAGAEFAKRVMGATCVAKRNDAADGNYMGSYFYVISNRETVVKFKITSNSITKEQTIPRTHFGCTTEWREEKGGKTYVLGETAPNQNNVYGIGAGANGHVWVNGHTPITTFGYQVKSAGNPISVKVRLGRGAWGYINRNPNWHASGYGCLSIDYRKDKVTAVTAEGGSAQNFVDGGWLSHVDNNGINRVYVNNNNKLHVKHWGNPSFNDATAAGAMRDLVKYVWNYSANMGGETRTYDQAMQYRGIRGCALGLNSDAGVRFINYYLNQKNHSGENIDQRVIGAGTTITRDSVRDLPEGGPSNGPTEIYRIHMELLSVEDGDFGGTMKNFLQDLNYVYGCNLDENYNDTNGRIEEFENPTASTNTKNYRREISANPDSSNTWFDSTVKWNRFYNSWDIAYKNMFGFSGKPNNAGNMISMDDKVGKPNTLDVRDNVAEKVRYRNVFDGSNKVSFGTYNGVLPMSIGSVYPRLPDDGRMFISKITRQAYKANRETNALTYEIMYADRREGKIGFLNYNRPAATDISDISYPTATNGRRVLYGDNTKAYVRSVDNNREYYCAYDDHIQAHFLHTAPYHVVVDSDNNPWFESQREIGKIQILPNDRRKEKYVYDVSAGSGLFAYENNNRLFESSIALLQRHADNGAYYSNELFPDGIRNGTDGFDGDVYAEGQELLDMDKFRLTMNTDANLATVYNIEPWKSGNKGPWDINNVFGGSGTGVWKHAYVKSSAIIAHADPYGGNIDNEFNSDNFGLNCLIQKNRVEVGPDVIHPRIVRPTAKCKILSAKSVSHADRCDVFDGKEFWDKYTEIFNQAQTASGYDDLDTVHYIYDIESNYRDLVYHRYVYHDKTAIGADDSGTLVRKHEFEYDDNYDLINLENIQDNSPDVVWHTPNYVGLVPPYDDLDVLASADPHAKNNQYWVDMYIDYTPTVYNIWANVREGQYESLHVGRHDVHVFERWPTNDFCVRGIGNDDSTDNATDRNLVGTYYWGECVNDQNN